MQELLSIWSFFHQFWEFMFIQPKKMWIFAHSSDGRISKLQIFLNITLVISWPRGPSRHLPYIFSEVQLSSILTKCSIHLSSLLLSVVTMQHLTVVILFCHLMLLLYEGRKEHVHVSISQKRMLNSSDKSEPFKMICTEYQSLIHYCHYSVKPFHYPFLNVW